MSVSINASGLNLYQTQGNFNSVSTSAKSTSNDEEDESTSSVMTKKLNEAEKSLEDDTTENYLTDTSAQGDTLSLSQAGMSAQAAGASVVSSSESDSSSDLSSYTEAQLKKMLQNGEITQAQYNAEIKSRTEEDSSDSSSSETSVPDAQATEIQMDTTMVEQLASM